MIKISCINEIQYEIKAVKENTKSFITNFYLEIDKIKIWIEKGEEVMLWKEFSPTMPASVEYSIDF